MKAVVAVILVLAGAGVASAQDQPEKFRFTEPKDIPIPTETKDARIIDLTLEDALQMADRSNSDLDVARLAPRRSRHDLTIAKAFYDSEVYSEAGINRQQNPSITTFDVDRDIYDAQAGWRTRMTSGALFDVNVSAIQTEQGERTIGGSVVSASEVYDASLNFSLTQPLLRGAWWEYGEAEIRRAAAAQAGAEDAYEQTRQDILLDVARAYWEFVFARADYRVHYQALELAREQLRITNARIAVKDLAPRDRFADETEVARQNEALIVAEAAIRETEDRLRALIMQDGSFDMWRWVLRPTDAVVPDLAGVEELNWARVAKVAVKTRPDLSRLRQDIAATEQRLVLAEGDTWPQLDLIGGYNSGARRTDNLEDTFGDVAGVDFPEWSLRLRFVYPIGNRAAIARRDRVALELEEAMRRLSAREIRIRREVRDAVRTMKTLAASIRASGESVRLSEIDLDTARHKQRVGTLTPFDVRLRNQELQEARSRLERNQVDFRISEAVLLHVQGKLKPTTGTGGGSGR